MERFGIFELLDALSALPRAEEPFHARETANEEFSPPSAPFDGSAEEPAPTRGGKTREPAPFDGRAEEPAPPRGGKTREPAPFDGWNEKGASPPEEMGALRSSAPNAPDGRAAHDPAPKALDGKAAHDPAPKALESFLKRHDALAKKAEKK